MGKIIAFAPWLALGPVTGLLAAAIVADARRGRRARVALWIALGAVYWIALPSASAASMAWVAHTIH
jgi:hypothetical protein